MRYVWLVLRGVLLTVLLVVCAVLFYLLVIMGDTPDVDISAVPTMPPEQVLSGAGKVPENGMYWAILGAELVFPAG